jgi:prolipoprotein diacylglyceryltransferase
MIFGWIWFRKTDSPSGSNFLLFAALTAGARLFVEAFRGDSRLIFGGIRLAQVVAWIALAMVLVTSELLQREKRES